MMAGLDSDKLYSFLCTKAGRGERVTEKEVAAHFGVDMGAVKKRFGLLAGHCVLEDRGDGDYDCSAVPKISKTAFESAGSQGKGNQEYVRQLLADIERHKKN